MKKQESVINIPLINYLSKLRWIFFKKKNLKNLKNLSFIKMIEGGNTVVLLNRKYYISNMKLILANTLKVFKI